MQICFYNSGTCLNPFDEFGTCFDRWRHCCSGGSVIVCLNLNSLRIWRWLSERNSVLACSVKCEVIAKKCWLGALDCDLCHERKVSSVWNRHHVVAVLFIAAKAVKQFCFLLGATSKQPCMGDTREMTLGLRCNNKIYILIHFTCDTEFGHIAITI